MTPAASPTPTPVQAQRAEDQASSGGTCCNFFQPTRRPHERSHVSGGSPGTAVLRNMGQGGAGWGLGRLADVSARRQGADGRSQVVKLCLQRRFKMSFYVQKLSAALLLDL